MILTEEKMKRALDGRLLPGKKVYIDSYEITGTVKRKRKKTSRVGYVVALYPHIFTVRVGDCIESFRYCQLFETSYERVRLA